MDAWGEAVVYGELGSSAADNTGQVWVQSFEHTYATSPLAGRGAWLAAAAHATTALAVARQINDHANIAYACSAAAVVASARAEWAEVVGVVDPLLGFPERDGTDEPGILPWRELSTDALVNLGRLDEAEHALIPFEEIAAARGRRSAMANAARVRSRLEAARGCRDAAETAFLAALSHAGAVPIPFDRAQTELAYGAFLSAERGGAPMRWHT